MEGGSGDSFGGVNAFHLFFDLSLAFRSQLLKDQAEKEMKGWRVLGESKS